MRRRTGHSQINQSEHLDSSGAKKTQEVLAVGKLFTKDISSATKVGRGSVLRVTIGAATYLGFSDDSDALQAATIDGSFGDGDGEYVIFLSASGTYNVAAPAENVKASTNPSRIELIEE